MSKWRLTAITIVTLSFLVGCMTPRLGYPVKTISIPTKVTLFSRIADKGTITRNLGYLARGAWSLLYQKRYEDLFAKIPVGRMRNSLNAVFTEDVNKASDMFVPSTANLLNANVPYTAPPKASTESGFDFSKFKSVISTDYILALTVDEWGYIAAADNDKNGPFIVLTIQLIDKNTNKSLWRHSGLYQEPTPKDAYVLTRVAGFEGILEKLIVNNTNRYFSWIESK